MRWNHDSVMSVADVVDDEDEDDDLTEEAMAKSIHVDRRADDDDEKEGKVTKVTRQKARKSKHLVGTRYPTQYMKIGEIKCIFMSCFYQGRTPFISLGPSWPFTSVLLLLACLILGYFYMMLRLGDEAHWLHMLWCKLCVGANLFCLFAGILGNPGIPQRHIDRILKD